MVRGRDAAIVLGLAVGATVAVLLLTNLLRLGDDLGATMAHPLARQTAGSSWLMPPGLTRLPAADPSRASASRRRVAAVASRVASPGRFPLARPAFLPQVSPPPADGPGLRRLAVRPQAPPTSQRNLRRAAPPAPRRSPPRPAPTTTPAPPALVTASERPSAPGPPAGAAAAPQELPPPAPPVADQSFGDDDDDAGDDRGKGKRDHGRGVKHHGHE
jgi:hypothetical protein